MRNARFLWLFCAGLLSCAQVFAESAELTTEDTQAFFDGLIPLQIETANVAGAVVAVVKDGKLIFANGYGQSDKENKTPVFPEKTLFRVASISKLFTSTSVMQQVELGRLELDRDINDYLDFKIPEAFDRAITLRDIMTHRTGFEESLDIIVNSEENLQHFSEYMKLYLPSRIYPPGTIPAYSNYAVTLAAYIVERVSGQKFEDYVEEHILKPLDMNHSTFRQPLPDAFKPFMSKGYLLGSEDPVPFELLELAPVGALTTTAEDMAHFMIMNLQKGRYGNQQILKPETVAVMHERQEGWPPSMPAMCLGFYEESIEGKRVIGHGGDTFLFHSNLYLILEANVGLFVSYNSMGQSLNNLPRVLFDKFMERYFPLSATKDTQLKTAAPDLKKVAGNYISSRRFETNFLAILGMLEEREVSVNSKDNTLSITGFNGLNQQPLHFEEIAPMIFRDKDGISKIDFVESASGRDVIYTNFASVLFQKVDNLADKKSVNFVILGFSLLVSTLTLLMWPIAWTLRKHYEKPLVLETSEKLLRVAVRLACLVIVVYGISLAFLVTRISNPTSMSIIHDNRFLYLLNALGLLVALGTLIAIYNCIKSWTNKNEWFWSKIWNTLLAVSCSLFLWFIYHWNFLNFI